MKIGVVTLFPEMFAAFTGFGVTGRAIKNGLLSLECFNPRDWAEDSYRTVDDSPYGGGPGMLMKCGPLVKALRQAKEHIGGRTVYMSPQGKPFTQAKARELAAQGSMILLAGRYEGVDERILKTLVDEEISIGDYVLSGGELPAMVVADAVARMVPGVLGDQDSAVYDSFMNGLLDYPQYTRPDDFDGMKVPEELLSGDHDKIAAWRRVQSVGRTYERRKDLIRNLALTDAQEQALAEYVRLSDSRW